MKRLHAFLTWALGTPEVLTSGSGQPYLIRWAFWRRRWGSLYLHCFVGSDPARCPHDHPRTFTTLGLWGRYYEEHSTVQHTLNRTDSKYSWKFLITGHRVFKAPWLRRFPAGYIHRLKLPPGKVCWTLVYAGAVTKPWGFWVPDYEQGVKWVPWREYLEDHDGQ